jgi:23S rRNA (uridine2552-2'-O)-methyltransferase
VRARPLAANLKPSKSRTPSSSRWLKRQLSDPYVLEAQKQGFRSRAAFKLIELDDRFRFLKSGKRVVDLGAAPGGWTQVAAQRVRPATVVALDLRAMDPVPGAVVLQADFLDPAAPQLLIQALAGPADVVLTDMAAPATGHASTDHLRIVALCEAALAFAVEVLAPGGTFVAKVLKGGTEQTLLQEMRRLFESVRHAKPNASRAESAESYVVAQGFRGRTAGS